MPGSQLLLLTVSAAVLLVPAASSLLAVERHRHLAELEGTTRRVRMVVAATLAGLGALAISAMAGAGPAAAVTTAVVLAAALLCWTPATRIWAVRGVVTWALLVVGVVALMGWLLVVMFSSLSGGELFAPSVAWALAATVLVRSRGWAWTAMGSRAKLGVAPPDQRAGVPGALLANAALVAAGAVAVAVFADGSAVIRWATPPQSVSIGSTDGTDVAETPQTAEPTALPTTTGSTRQQTPSPSSSAADGVTATPATSPARRPTRRPTPAPVTGVPAGVPEAVTERVEGMRGARAPLPSMPWAESSGRTGPR